MSIQQNQRGIHVYILCVASSVQLTGTEATSLVNTYVFDTVYANPALTGPKKGMEELEQNFLDGFLEVPDFASREPSPVPSLTPRTSKKRAALGNVDTNVEREAEQPKRKKKTSEKQQKPSGVILDIAEFDEQQKNTREDETCKDHKRIVHTVTKMEKHVAALDKKIEELTQKIDWHIQEWAPADATHQTPADAAHQTPTDATFATAFSEQALKLPCV